MLILLFKLLIFKKGKNMLYRKHLNESEFEFQKMRLFSKVGRWMQDLSQENTILHRSSGHNSVNLLDSVKDYIKKYENEYFADPIFTKEELKFFFDVHFTAFLKQILECMQRHRNLAMAAYTEVMNNQNLKYYYRFYKECKTQSELCDCLCKEQDFIEEQIVKAMALYKEHTGKNYRLK